MKKQTAVEWLMSELNSEINYIPVVQWDRIRDLVQRAKAMEREQIVDAFVDGIDSQNLMDAENYYNKKYGGEQ